ncbi:protein of unknown function [Pseudomonas sp. NFPP33]|nr:DUF3560 domain-containing protein [Pseudomonas sp. NFPP33]SDA85243.1 protein of unknown function [Pseudomonas sp. NFPP33]
MNSYEAKQQARKDRLEERAAGAIQNSDAAYRASHKATEGIVMGQPILVGHHSEGRHRGAIKRANNSMRKSVEEARRAEELQRRADAVGTGGISSDDPEAVRKLREQLATITSNQEFMKAANKVVKSKKSDQDKIAALVAQGFTEESAARHLQPDYAGRVGFPSYMLSNNNANMRRIEQRIKDLEAQAQRESKAIEGSGYTYHEDTDENRVMFRFPGKPAEEVREMLKKHAFRWSPSRDAWVRQLTGNGVFAGHMVRRWLDQQAEK